jgi:hypothetical protein
MSSVFSSAQRAKLPNNKMITSPLVNFFMLPPFAAN